MTQKKLYKTTYIVEVLSEEPLGEMSLSSIDYEITEGHCSGSIRTESEVVLTGKKAVEAVKAQGTDPEFFIMDNEGNELENDGEGYEWEEEEE